MINRIQRVAVLAAIVWLASAGAMAQPAGRKFTIADAELTRLGVTLATGAPVQRIEVVSAPAEIVVPPPRQALVSAPQAGVVARLLVAEGDSVAAGQPLAEIDSVDYLEKQRDYLDAAAAADLATTQETRDRALFEEGIIAERRLAETSAAARAARSHLEQAQAQLELAGLSRAELERLGAQRKLATRLVLRAPLSGTVTTVHATVGGRVDALDPVLAVADLRELWIVVRLPQESASRVAPGMSVAVMPPGSAEVVGAVTTVGGVVDAATQTVLVRGVVENTNGALRAGQFLSARIRAQTAAPTVALPVAAVTRDGGDALVFVRAGGEVEVRRVQVVGDDGTHIYIGGDLESAERVAVGGISALKALWLSTAEEGG
jgi:cobalt-zinc-cadmium efflux system membrane fusion protein